MTWPCCTCEAALCQRSLRGRCRFRGAGRGIGAQLGRFDISKSETPRSISFFDCSGPHSRANHQGWFGDGEFVQFVSTEFHRWAAAIREIGMTPDCFSPRYPLPTFLLPPVSQSSRPSTTAPARNMPWIASPHITCRSS